MKINDRTLVQVVHSSTAPVDRCGWLCKRGELNKSFQKRWCVLKGNLFYYFDRKTDREPMGVIIIEGCRVEVAENETQLFAFKIDFGSTEATDTITTGHTTGQLRTYVLASETQEDMESWMRALSCASYDYLKSVVAELQSRLDDINRMADQRRQRQSTSSIGAAGGECQRTNPFDTEVLDVLDASRLYGAQPDRGVLFTRRPFAESHEFYGLKFKDYIQRNRNESQK